MIYMPTFLGIEFNSGVSDAAQFLLEIFSRNAKMSLHHHQSILIQRLMFVNNCHYDDFIPNVSVVYVLQLITHFQ